MVKMTHVSKNPIMTVQK